MTSRIAIGSLALAMTALPLAAQRGGGRGGQPQTPRAMAPIDLTGYWVSVVNEDWRYRMVVPPPGDYMGVPMNAESKKVADAWDPARDEASGDRCKAYGAPALLRQPGLLHITWQDDQTLRLDTDAGTQTRLFHFGDWKAPAGPPTLQGDSLAVWEVTGAGRGNAGSATDSGPTGKGTLKAATSHLKAGYLRKNGVPYSENATLTEYFDMLKAYNGDVMLVVTIVTSDRQYLREPFIITSHFKKQNSDAGWTPSACSTKW